MKKQFISLIAVALATLVAGCGSHDKMSERTKEVFDMGSVPINNNGYSLHGYRLLNGTEHDHFVYILEKNGEPVAGTATNYSVSQGKGSVNESVSSQVAPSALQ